MKGSDAVELILKYFPSLTPLQQERFRRLGPLYNFWNERINVISRKDIDALYERHILHSLAIGRIISFRPDTRILDVGTGGGFPGIPLAILFPEVNFLLVDSIGKKISVVEAIAADLHLENVKALQIRAEQIREKFDFVASRAVTALPVLLKLVAKTIAPGGQNPLPNGILYLKGGDFDDELKTIRRKYVIYHLTEIFAEPFFETKKLVFIPA
ncbi:MAG: 16S rRNA (guanine(527)-N(7))-methyltransferase RsmG [Bacteroidota bacterium]|nr:16S rRNA (guanine(527)-N(7))-methyltransferase RsmG [Bacteroidota bacterium]HNU77562.1 16S rRNA (guanine(527)-N(7))-methyltransferase RsmG [Prolixibacteraceae bacterium]HNZ68460.1 16S rRNA (guanine(527)-N(7))-methyltransferase RsmG [Prolixibacteraceae bacterium]HOC86311.1 16S rRNA (guanine(527)-N(7))-methyltransferase RsmG [Prolixibacteraceae bacterium]HOG95580.1 16S rRNA (guanine(527)-N(7))-methyltransferase RsmG [Prolixibacteraceae bacterium]